jgi:flagellar biogenesis protein FliO
LALKSFLNGVRSNRPVGLDYSWWGMAGITLTLAICGGVYAACRRLLPQNAAGSVQVVSRVSLSPKHTVYVLRIGRRALLVGAGPQGAPALITELDDFPDAEPSAPSQGVEP